MFWSWRAASRHGNRAIVQVKTSNYRQNDRYCVTLATRGGNQSYEVEQTLR